MAFKKCKTCGKDFSGVCFSKGHQICSENVKGIQIGAGFLVGAEYVKPKRKKVGGLTYLK